MFTNIFPKTLRQARILLWTATGLTAILAGLLLWRATAAPTKPMVRITGEAAITNAYTLTDHRGQPVTADSFIGQWQLIFFGFTYCPDICPTTLAYMGNVMDLLGEEAENVVPIFITVDPERDTPEVLADYVSAFHPRMIGLTGSKAQVVEAADNFRVWYERSEDATAPDGYLVAHSGYIYVMRPDGQFVDVFLETDQPAEELAQKISTYIEKEEQS